MFRRHVLLEHPMVLPGDYICVLCFKRFPDINKLIHHMRRTNCQQESYNLLQHSLEASRTEANDVNNNELHNFDDLPAIDEVLNDFRAGSENESRIFNFILPDFNDTDESETEENTLEESTNQILKSWTSFLANLCGNLSINRKTAFDILKMAKTTFFDSMIKCVRKHFLDDEKRQQFQLIIKQFEEHYKTIDTEFKFNNYLQKKDYLRKPIEITLDSEIQTQRRRDHMVIENVETKIVAPDVEFELKSFLELPNMFRSIENYQQKVSNNPKIINVLNGRVMQQLISEHQDKFIIPVFLYFDDFVPFHARSKRTTATSLAAFYLMFPTLPPELRSLRENLVNVGVIQTQTVKKISFDKCLEYLVTAFQNIEENGLEIVIDGNVRLVHPVIVQVCGDNKGLCEILNMTGSFNSNSDYICRLCVETAQTMSKQVRENSENLRNITTHESHLAINNFRLTGLKGDCFLNQLSFFKSYRNKVVDFHHDLLHGDCGFCISLSLQNFIFVQKLFNLERFNEIRRNFVAESLGRNENYLPFTKENLTKENIPLDACQMKQFCLFLPLMIKHLVRNKQDPFWRLIILLTEIVENALQPEHDMESVNHLNNVVEQHNSLFIDLARRGLRPKQHNKIHYGSSILDIGPICHYSALRGEAKHQELKKVANLMNCRKNVPKTLLVANSYSTAARKLRKNSTARPMTFGKITKCNGNRLEECPQLHIDLSRYSTTKMAEVNGITYKENYVLSHHIYRNFQPIQIKVILCRPKVCLFICQILHGFTYDPDVRAHIRPINYNLSNEAPTYTIVNVSDVVYEPSLLIELPNGEKALKFYRKLEQ
jgi:hypothetical protein